MADDKWKHTFERRFDIPDIARERAQAFVNAGGDPFHFDTAFDMLGDELPDLNDKQRASIFEQLDDLSKKLLTQDNDRIEQIVQRWADKGMTPAEIEERKKTSKMYKHQLRSRDRNYMTHGLSNDHYKAGGKFLRNRTDAKLHPTDVFPDNRKGQNMGGAVTRLQNMVAEMKEKRLATEAEAKKPKLASPSDTGNMPKQKDIAKFLREGGMKVVKSVGPKMAAMLGGPIGWGIAGASTLMDTKDAYATMVEPAQNPTNERELMMQRMMVDSMRNPTEYDRQEW